MGLLEDKHALLPEMNPRGAGLPRTYNVLACIDAGAATYFVLGPLSDQILNSGGLVVDGQYV